MNQTFRVFLVIAAAMSLLCGCGARNNVYLEKNTGETGELCATEELSATETEESDGTKEEKTCLVYVCGAVVSPGVYELDDGSRIYEAVELAGGFMEEAAEDALNLAESVTDGQMIRIPTEEEQEAAGREGAELSQGAGADSASDGKLDLNRADVAALMELPGIGQSKAEAIVGYREEHGPFSRTEDLMKVEGIKEGVFNKIKDRIKVD